MVAASGVIPFCGIRIGCAMKFEITLRRKQTLNAEQNARQLRIQEEAPNESVAKAIVLLKQQR